jgi:hypothetical protein
MSALGQKQTLERLRAMSALPPKADIGTHSRDVRFVPKADIVRRSAECRYSINSETQDACFVVRDALATRESQKNDDDAR